LPTVEDQGNRINVFMGMGWNCEQNKLSLGGIKGLMERMGSEMKK
jgi:hypothetical protein